MLMLLSKLKSWTAVGDVVVVVVVVIAVVVVALVVVVVRTENYLAENDFLRLTISLCLVVKVTRVKLCAKSWLLFGIR